MRRVIFYSAGKNSSFLSWKKIAIALFLAVAWLFLLSNTANASSCPKMGQPTVDLNIEDSYPRFNYNKSIAELSHSRVDSRAAQAMSQGKIGGLTVGNVKLSQVTNFQISSFPEEKESCISISRVLITISLDSTVHVAKDYPKGSCLHQEIYNHELKHVEADRIVVRKFAGQIRQAAEKQVIRTGVIGPFSSMLTDANRQALFTKVDQQVQEAAEQMFTIRDKMQQDIDSPQEYLRISMACHGK
ncbi:MAG: hypothetical protein ACOYK8_06280 [Alphaproteobacteria bacterium]